MQHTSLNKTIDFGYLWNLEVIVEDFLRTPNSDARVWLENPDHLCLQSAFLNTITEFYISNSRNAPSEFGVLQAMLPL